MRKTIVLNVVGLTPALIGRMTPRLRAFAEQGRLVSLNTVFPAVTCSVQASFLTGCYPERHGIVGNGWYYRDECEVKFWQQSHALIQPQAPRVWDVARTLNPEFTCANLFWWFNMYSSVDYAVTPRPMYLADGRKFPDIYTKPADLRDPLQKILGQFPLFHFWGPQTSIDASRWIVEAARYVDQRYNPTLTFIYLPHLDYCLQRTGPVLDAISHDLAEIDTLCGELINYYQRQDARVIVLSEYGITSVSRAVHLNRELRKHGMITVRQELKQQLLDAGASVAFAVADHQVAHVYINDKTRIQEVHTLLQNVPGVAQVLDEKGKREAHLDHPRSGDLVVLAQPDAWFTYYYWLDDTLAPDYARTVDIHRKPGYDPVELFLNPQCRFPQLKVGWKLLRSRLGFRTLLDVIPLDASLVHGSHGLINASRADSPVFITQIADLLASSTIEATDVFTLILRHLTGS